MLDSQRPVRPARGALGREDGEPRSLREWSPLKWLGRSRGRPKWLTSAGGGSSGCPRCLCSHHRAANSQAATDQHPRTLVERLIRTLPPTRKTMPQHARLLGTLVVEAPMMVHGVDSRHERRRPRPDIHGRRPGPGRGDSHDRPNRGTPFSISGRQGGSSTGDAVAPRVCLLRPLGTANPVRTSPGTASRSSQPTPTACRAGKWTRRLANLNDVAMQARIVPSFKDMQANGVQTVLHSPGLHLLEDWRSKRRRHRTNQRLRHE